MIEKMIDRTKKMHTATGNHILSCADKVAQNMTNDEIAEFAAEVGRRRFTSTAIEATTGCHRRTGEALSERDARLARNDMINLIGAEIDARIRIENIGR